jgi:hypothetical protein
MGTLDNNVRVGTRDEAHAIEIRRLRAEVVDLGRRLDAMQDRAQRAEGLVRELRASGRETLLETTRRGLREYGAPPPGEGTHPLQGHRDSMG